MYIWLPDYLSQVILVESPVSKPCHIMFLFADHYEPGLGQQGVEINREWLANYRQLADKHQDSYGHKPQHTWFYAYDHHNAGVMSELSHVVGDGYGEIEFHWHHKHDTNETFRQKLAEGIKWFNSFGAMIADNKQVSFGFIHGNWSLDNSRGSDFCGVNRELDILKQAGCYADFTFPALGNKAQPSLVNRIYYAHDDDRPKSYDHGVDAVVGKRNLLDLMIFEGPINFTDYGAVENYDIPNRRKIDRWIDANIHVKGRPELIFVKVFTHGVQSRTIYDKHVDDMFTYLEERYGKGDYRLHYVTAREGYNIVRAAEDGKYGDPDRYRDYEIAIPINKKKLIQ